MGNHARTRHARAFAMETLESMRVTDEEPVRMNESFMGHDEGGVRGQS